MNRTKSRKAGKRIFSIMLAVLLLFNYIPETVYAGTVNDGEDVSVSGNVANYDSVSSDDADETVSDNTYDESGDAAGDESDNIPDEPSSVSDNDSEYSENNDAEDTVSDNSVSDNDVDDYSQVPDFPTGGNNEIEDTIDIENVNVKPTNYVPNLRGSVLPVSYTTPNLPDLRNQYPYGTCWAHSAMALAEISLIKQEFVDPSVDLSELHLAYFSYNTVIDPLGGLDGDSNACLNDTFMDRGGNISLAENVLFSWTGAASEETAPYSNASSALVNGLSTGIAYTDLAHMTACYETTISTSQADINAVKQMVYDYGAVGISYYAVNSMSAVTSQNIYSTANNCYYNSGASGLTANHAVTIVGWDDSFAKENFATQPAGDGAWLIRNSWTTGTVYSYSGYFWMSYYEPSIDDDAVSYVFELENNYDNNYQYDGGMQSNSVPGTKFANVFTAHAEGGDLGETIEAIAFYTPTSNVTYTVNIYGDVTGTNPESGTLIATQTGTTTYAGYYTVKLKKPCTVEKNTKFSVVISLSKEGYTAEMGYEQPVSTSDWYQVTTHADAGESYIYNGSWRDFTNYYSNLTNSNLRIKAFTNNVQSGEIVAPESIEIDDEILSNGITLGVTQSYTVSAKVNPSNTTNRKLIWTSSDTSIATVANGVVTGVSSGTAVITVKCDADNTIYKTFSVTVDADTLISISVSADSQKFKRYSEYTFSASANPSTASLEGLTWSSSNTNVATIDSTGKVKTVGVGKTTITATCGNITGSKEITVYPDAPNFTYYTDDDNTIKLYWEAVDGATGYEINYNQKEISIVSEEGKTNYEYEINDYSGIEYSENNCVAITVYALVPSVDSTGTYGYGLTQYVYYGPTYTIIYDVGNGTNNANNPSTYKYGRPGISFQNPIAPKGYTFKRWYYIKNNTTYTITGISSTYYFDSSTKSLKVYAEYKPITYTIAFNNNGGTGTINSVSCTYDTAKTLPACTFTKNGYTFTGWNTKADGTGTSYAPGASVSNLTSTQGATVTLYAQWSKGSYTIVFNANNGTGTMNNQVCAFDEEITLSANTYTRTGYTFAGWNTQSNGNGTSYADKASVKNLAASGSITLYAQWTPITYTIAFDGNGGTGTMSSVSCTYDSAKTLPTCTFTKTGYSFYGWNTKADGTGISYADKASITNLTSTQGATVTLYAKWKANTYTVAFNSNGGTGTMSSMTGCTYDNAYYLTDNKFKLTGYMFAGWNTKADGTGTSYADCATVANLATSGTVTLYAQWTPITYTIAFDGNGGTGTSASMTQCSYDNSIVLTANGFTKEGYTFTGWNTSSDGKGVAYADGASVKNMSSVQGATITLYAQWKANKYTVVFDANSGTGTMNSLECTYGTSSILPQCLFTKQGYTFAGWNTEPDGTGINYGDKADVLNLATEGNITLYAMWEGMPVTVTLCANGGQFDDGNTDKQITVYYNGKYTSLVTPERAGFTFGGWYVSLAGGNEITTNTPVTSCASHKLYAKWIANDGWHVSGRSSYYTSGGNRVYGQYDFSESESYYFNPSTGLLMTGLIKTAEGTYYGDSSQGGKLIKGEKVIGSNTYLFADGYRMVTGWYDNCYYDEITGARQTGFIEIEGNTYYLNPEKVTGWQDIDGDRYYFDTNGIMVTGHQADINGKEYYFTEDGQLMTGWIDTDAGEIYAVETDDVLTGETIGEIVKDRDRLIDGTMYKFNADGSVYAPEEPGVTEIGGKYYFFNADGVAVKGWYTFDDGKTYYFGSDGAALLGNQVINLKAYQFDADGVLTNEYKPGSSTFFNDEDGDKYYINKYGKAVTGWIYSGNSKYYMNTETGAAVKYAYKVGLKVYYFDAECRLVSSGNTVQIGNTTYSIKNDSSLKTGWVRTGGIWQSIPEPVMGIPGTVTQLPQSTGYIPEPMTSTQALAACQSVFNTENFESVYDVTSDTAGTDSVTDIIMTVDFEQLPVSTMLATHADYHCLSSKNMMANY